MQQQLYNEEGQIEIPASQTELAEKIEAVASQYTVATTQKLKSEARLIYKTLIAEFNRRCGFKCYM